MQVHADLEATAGFCQGLLQRLKSGLTASTRASQVCQCQWLWPLHLCPASSALQAT